MFAMRANDLSMAAQGLAEVVYSAYQAGWAFGVDLDCIVAELHRANMSKLDSSGHPIHRADGKVLKSSSFVPPNAQTALASQLPLTSPQPLVRQFHEAFNLDIADSPVDNITPELANLRCALIQEEFQEVHQGRLAADYENLLLELGDVLYVAYGSAVSLGIDLDATIAEVHRMALTGL